MVSGQTAVPSSLLGKDQFLNLFVTQARNQNPLDPMEGPEFLAQLAQFSSVEQLSNLSSSFENFLKSHELEQARGLIGMDVTYLADDLNPRGSGAVTGVKVLDGNVFVEIGDKLVKFESVDSIRSAATQSGT